MSLAFQKPFGSFDVVSNVKANATPRTEINRYANIDIFENSDHWNLFFVKRVLTNL